MKSTRIQRASNVFINLFYLPLIFISFLGAVNLILATFNGVRPIPMGIFSAIMIVVFVSCCITSWRHWWSRVWHISVKYFSRHKVFYVIVLAVITITWQVIVVRLLSGTSYWDPLNIMTGAIQGKVQPKLYFSYNSNTLLLMYVEHALWILLSKPDFQTLVLSMNYINIFILDLAAILMANVVKNWFGRKYVPLVVFFTWSLFLITPWVALTYTDDYAFFLTALNIWLAMYYQLANHNWQKLLCAGGLGLSLTISYLMKPSLIIFFIAFLLVSLLRKFNIKRQDLTKGTAIVSVVIGLVCAGGVYASYQVYTNNQKLAIVDTKLSHPATHFIAMGMTGSGRYNEEDVKLDESIKSPKKRQAANIKLIQQRLTAFGPANYAKFLIAKQVADTSDASYGWGNDGVFLVVNNVQNKELNKLLPRQLFTTDGTAKTTSWEYRFIVQVIWAVALFFMLFAANKESWRSQLLKYGVVGGMVFLLIFEGGRSRYLIQFLPMFLVLAAVCGQDVIDWSRSHFGNPVSQLGDK